MFEDLVSQEIKDLVPYPPGKPLEELERELGIAGAVKLASNENSLGPSPKAQKALAKAVANLHRYPDGRGYYLKKALADRLGLAMEEIVIGNGSNEIIELAVRTFLRPGGEAVFSDPTFLVYSKVVQGAGGVIKRVPLKNFTHDLAGLARAVGENTRLLFLDNPNNPTGALTPVADLKAFIQDLPRHTVMILDEAYMDFVRQAPLLDPREAIDRGWPLVFLRTFSKIYGLAGLRIGYGLAHRQLVDYFDRVRQPFNVNSMAQVGALASLDDDEFYQESRTLVWEGLEWLAAEVERLGFRTYPSQTNFLMIELDRPAKDLADLLLHQGVIVRSLASYGMDRFLRISVGLPDENRRVIAALERVLS